MIITPFEMLIESDQYREVPSDRSPGLHLSQIISELDKAAHGDRYPNNSEQARQGYFSMGFMYEQMLSHIIRDTAIKYSSGRLVRPGEFLLDGIAMSPDALDVEDWVLEEYKATYVSSSNDILSTKFWPWIIQMKCYCKASATRIARLRVWFIVGDWKGSGPQMKCWQFEFDDREIDEAWSMCMNHAKYRGWL